jgi:hypothetical protein
VRWSGELMHELFGSSAECDEGTGVPRGGDEGERRWDGVETHIEGETEDAFGLGEAGMVTMDKRHELEQIFFGI